MDDRTRWLTWALGGLFLLLGLSKLAGLAPWPELFARWDYAPGLRPAAGGVEVAGAVLLFVPRLVPVGAALLGAVMIAAAATHLWRGVVPMALAPLTLLVLLAAAARGALRRAALRRRGPAG